MISPVSIKTLYPLALAEGEGMGTAYEYYTKRLSLAGWLSQHPLPQSILIAGLPERYGASLDFILLATELGAEVTVVDDRPSALEHLQASLAAAATIPELPVLQSPAAVLVMDLATLPALNTQFDLVISSEVLQRLSAAAREAYITALPAVARRVALFAPSADNTAHTTISGLSGLYLQELQQLVGMTSASPEAAATHKLAGLKSGYIDMPPFPPGITRSEEQRSQATTGKFEALVMWGLQRYAHLERFLPGSIRRRQSHIVFAYYSL